MSDIDKIESLEREVADLKRDGAIIQYRMGQMESHLLVTAQKLDGLPEKIAKVLDEKLITHERLCNYMPDDSKKKDKEPKEDKTIATTHDIYGRVIAALIGLVAALAGVKLIP